MKAEEKALICELIGASGRNKLANMSSINAVAEATREELVALGVTVVQMRKLQAAFAIGRRALEVETHGGACTPRDVFHRLRPRFAGLKHEAFVMLALNNRNQVLEEFEVARGSLTGVEVHPREVFRPLIRIAAAGCVAVHNHPTGDPTPSAEDVLLTRRLREVGELVGIPMIDHVIIANNRFASVYELLGC